MPWMLQGLSDGQPPAAYTWVSDDYTPHIGEVVTGTDPVGLVWHAETGTLRGRTPEEQTALEGRQLATLKAKRRAELIADADAAYKREIPGFAAVVVAAKFVPPNNTQYLTPNELVIFNKINAGYQRFNNLWDQIQAANTVAALDAVPRFDATT